MEGSGELAVPSADELTSVGEVRVEPGERSAGDAINVLAVGERDGMSDGVKRCTQLDP